MQTDNQGRALLRLPTTMRYAFAAAVQRGIRPFPDGTAKRPTDLTMLADRQLQSNHGYRKVPAWTVTRKGGR